VDGEKVLNLDNTGSVFSTAFNTSKNKFENKYPDKAVRLLNVHLI
jgi:hypothetical protein